MTKKQQVQFNKMRAALLTIWKDYQTPAQLRKGSKSQYGLDPDEAIDMSYENIQAIAKNAVAGVKEAAPVIEDKDGKKLAIAIDALKDIKNWNEGHEQKWEDPGYRAIDALNKISK